MISELPGQCSTTDWSRHFTSLLTAFEFHKGRTLSSEEYQTAEAWNVMLCNLVRLDSLGGKMNFQKASRTLLQTASEIIFQPRSDDVAVQVLGVMEASGLEFDYLWVMGMHDGIWPPSPRPDPFIPTALQRQRMMPHSCAKRELQVTAHITSRLAGNAREVIFSYPARNQDNVLRPSPLLQDYQQRDKAHLPQWQDSLWQASIFRAAQQESWTETKVPLSEVNEVRGGSQLFKLQAMCPFRAFAELRLGARPMTEAGMGLDPAQRGSLLHQVMEYFWNRVMNQHKLLLMSDEDLDKTIQKCVTRAIDRLEQSTGQNFNQRFKSIEQERLEQLVHTWITVEKQRQPFSVSATEQTVIIYVKDMQIKLKIDRIDELENGDRLLIDYKTGSVTPAQWFGDRPEEPQLPLYSVALPEQLSGLLFAQLKSGETNFKGITRDNDLITGVKSCQQLTQARESGGWEALLQKWKLAIESLAEEYKQGHAPVSPLKYPASCQYCSLPQLCRINELSVPGTTQSETD
jgi:probable DNA repair protein